MGKKKTARAMPPPESNPEITKSFKRTFNSWLLSERRMKLAARRRRNRTASTFGIVSTAFVIVAFNLNWWSVVASVFIKG